MPVTQPGSEEAGTEGVVKSARRERGGVKYLRSRYLLESNVEKRSPPALGDLT